MVVSIFVRLGVFWGVSLNPVGEKNKPKFLNIEHPQRMDREWTQEEEYYAEEKREHVATTRSGRKVYSVPRLIVPIPDNEEDMVELAKFDSEHGEDCLDGLSDVSLEGEEGEDGGDYEDKEEEEESDSSSSSDSETGTETEEEVEETEGSEEDEPGDCDVDECDDKSDE